MALAWSNQCWCDSGERGVDWGAQGEAPVMDCDSTGTVEDDPVGVADLCGLTGIDPTPSGFAGSPTGGQPGQPGGQQCGYRNAVYGPVVTGTPSDTTAEAVQIKLDQLDGVSVILGNGAPVSTPGNGVGGSVYTLTDEEVDETLTGTLSLCSKDFGCGFIDAATAPHLIDNDHSPGSWVSSPSGAANDCSTRLYVTVDLGRLCLVNGVTAWHYYGDNHAYCSQKIAISVTGIFGGEEFVVHDSADGCTPAVGPGGGPIGCYGPPETVDGNAFTFPRTLARYVRHWSSRNTQNIGIHMLEIDVYGTTAPTTSTATFTYELPLLDSQLELTDSRSLELRMVRVAGREAFGGGGTGLGAGMSLQAGSQCRAEHVEFVGNTQRGIGASVWSAVVPMPLL